MKTPDRISLTGGHSEDVFIWCEDCRTIIGVDPDDLAELLGWVEEHTCDVVRP